MALTPAYRERLAAGETLEDLLPEAFAACRESARRFKNMRHFDVQIVGGIVLHRGNITEMVTGEGKTLVATLPAYLNALEQKGVHIVTVNDYLARRDCEWMSPIYHALGISAGFIQSDMDPVARRRAYDCDITYGTNSEFGFDYLRDNMKPARWGDPNYDPHYQQCQRIPLNFAIIDEVDNILIDEARTPLIISGPSFGTPKLYEKANQIAIELTRLEKKAQEKLRSLGHGVNIPNHPLMKEEADAEELETGVQDLAVAQGVQNAVKPAPNLLATAGANGDGDDVDDTAVESYVASANVEKKEKRLGYFFEVKEKERSCHLTDEGIRKAEELAGVESFYTAGNMEWPHLIDNALKAHHLYIKDRQYLVMRDPEPPHDMSIIIVDEFTGRPMLGRQWSDGQHQPVQAKHPREGVKIKEETQTLATITLQNYFKLYKKLAGMTGTAMTEANEFWKVYKLDVIAIPTNRGLTRQSFADVIYRTDREKYNSILEEIREVHETGRPILVGTTSIEKSELISDMLSKYGIKHQVLNAKFHEQEAEIVAQAGRKAWVTIAT